MSFPSVDWSAVKVAAKQAWDANGSDCDFTLKDATAFTIKGTQGHRLDQQLTAGASQQQIRVRVLYDDWHQRAGAGRAPEKGDQFTMWGRRYQVQEAHSRGAADVGIVYVLICRG